MAKVNHRVEVNAPIEQVFRMWQDYENFPRFMKHVEEVRRTGPDRTHWKAKAAGQEIEWDARTTAENNRRVSWQAEGESGQSGEVRFEPVTGGKTRIEVEMDYHLDSKLREGVASAFGIDDRAVANDLETFKDMAEGRR